MVSLLLLSLLLLLLSSSLLLTSLLSSLMLLWLLLVPIVDVTSMVVVWGEGARSLLLFKVVDGPETISAMLALIELFSG